MADINSGGSSGHSGARHARGAYRGTTSGDGPTKEPGVDEEALIGIVELLFFAYRDFTGEADAVLQEFGFGRAHHRVLHFVNRRPGLRVADLLDILRITKQSLARVLKELVDRGFIAQSAGDTDRRERRLFLTPNGKALAGKLAGLQVAQIGQALAAAGAGSVATGDAQRLLYDFLVAMIGPEQRASIASAIAQSTPLGQSEEKAPGSAVRATTVRDTQVRDKSVK